MSTNDIRRLGVKHGNSHYSIAPNNQQNKWVVILMYCMYVHVCVSFISGSAAHITNKQTREEAERWIDIKQTQANYSAKYSNTHLRDYYSFPLKCNRIVSGASQSEKQCGETIPRVLMDVSQLRCQSIQTVIQPIVLYINVKKLQFIHMLMATDLRTSKTAKIKMLYSYITAHRRASMCSSRVK